MATTEISKSRSICILAIVVCCFAILWPKIFLPMFQTALSLSSSQSDHHISDKQLPGMLPPKVREAMKLSRPEEIRREPGRPFQKDRVVASEQNNKTGGIMGFAMPLYTIGIVIFFLYTMFKMVFKNKSDDEPVSDDEKPKVQDFQMDPEYRKFILSDEYDENGVRIKKTTNSKRKSYLNTENNKKNKNIQKTEKIVEDYGKDKEENEINRLQKRLEDTEAAMERILKQMNKMSGELVVNGILPSATFYKNDQNIINKLKFKAKLIEVEECRVKIAKIESAKVAAQKSLNKSKRELSEDQQSNESNEETSEQEEENFDEEENSDDVCHQNIDKLNPESIMKSKNDEKDVNEEIENANIECMYEQSMKEKLLNNLDPNVWESVKKGMQELQKLKEE